MLLDEADVFLERRSVTDLNRNNLVAIFLRSLEYYQGILLLTTNRIGTFDEAFLSRIDVPIYFPALSNDQRAKIWGTFFSKLERERQGKIRVSQDVRYYVKEDRDLLKLEWNGREIRSGSSSCQNSGALVELTLRSIPDSCRSCGNRRPGIRAGPGGGEDRTHRKSGRDVQGVQGLPRGGTQAKCG